jgi:hypothetical protein
LSWRWQMTFYIRLTFTSGLALRIKGAAYFTKFQLSETDNSVDLKLVYTRPCYDAMFLSLQSKSGGGL